MNERVLIEADISPYDGTNADVEWSSSDPGIVAVDDGGYFTGVETGTVTITASCGSVSDTCTVTVVNPVADLSLDSTAETLELGDTVTLSADVSPSGATNADVTWQSNNTSVATVSSGGTVTAVSEGAATITAEAGGITDACTVIVVKTDVTDLSLSSTSETLELGGTVTLTATVSPSGATYPDVTWASSDTSVATVNSSGKITAVAEGAATIIAEADGVCGVLHSDCRKNGRDGSRPFQHE